MSEPSSQNPTRIIQFYTQTHTHTHCLNKPAQLTMTHFMFPVVAWLAGLEYFACILSLFSWISHSHRKSFHRDSFFRVMTCCVQLNSCQQSPRAKHNTRLSNNWATFFFFCRTCWTIKTFTPTFAPFTAIKRCVLMWHDETSWATSFFF